jgi:two-component system LytT family response regulator
MRALIIENEEDAQSLLLTLIKEYVPEVKVAGIAATVKEGILAIEELEPDILFLDIDLDDGTGFDLLDQLEEVDFALIFTTAFNEYAIKAFKYNAVDYLLKPFSIDELAQSIERAKISLSSELAYSRIKALVNQVHGLPQGKIPIYTLDGINVYQVNEIIRLEADRSYCNMILESGKEIIVSKPLKVVESILPLHAFFRPHKSHIININYVSKYIKEQGGYILMSNGDEIPISRRKKDEFISLLTGS